MIPVYRDLKEKFKNLVKGKETWQQFMSRYYTENEEIRRELRKLKREFRMLREQFKGGDR